MELEFFLLRENAEGGIELADPLDKLEQPCYDMKGLTRQYEFLSRLSTYINQLGWGSYANDHEDANGQFESNFEFADALTTADRAIFFRYMVHAMAQEGACWQRSWPSRSAISPATAATSTCRSGTRAATPTCSPMTTTPTGWACPSSATSSRPA